MTTFTNHVYSVGHFKYHNEIYVFASGNGAGLNVFKLSDVKQSGYTSKFLNIFLQFGRKRQWIYIC